MKTLLATAALVAVLSSPAAAVLVYARADCVVADPTGSPLNVRSTPNGAILGALRNDTKVLVLEAALVNGKTSVRIAPEVGTGKQGWVFLNHLSCS
jgi:hypothetical protein